MGGRIVGDTVDRVLDGLVVGVEGVSLEGLGADALVIFADAGVSGADARNKEEALLAGETGQCGFVIVDDLAVNILVNAVAIVKLGHGAGAIGLIQVKITVAVAVSVQEIFLVAVIAVIRLRSQHVAIDIIELYRHQAYPCHCHVAARACQAVDIRWSKDITVDHLDLITEVVEHESLGAARVGLCYGAAAWDIEHLEAAAVNWSKASIALAAKVCCRVDDAVLGADFLAEEVDAIG